MASWNLVNSADGFFSAILQSYSPGPSATRPKRLEAISRVPYGPVVRNSGPGLDNPAETPRPKGRGGSGACNRSKRLKAGAVVFLRLINSPATLARG